MSSFHKSDSKLYSTVPGESKKECRRLEGCGVKSVRPIFKTEMLIYQSKVNLDEKILFGALILQTRKLGNAGMLGNENSTFHSGP